jgi:hypothetical protein
MSNNLNLLQSLNYRNLMSNTRIPYRLQMNNYLYFRESLLKETGMVQYQVHNPLQLANELRRTGF